MGTLYLVRHGQASLGADNYDQLSHLGLRQSVRLGEYFARTGLKFSTVMTGTLQRHAQTWAGIEQGMGVTASSATAIRAIAKPSLNEYDSHALVNSVQSTAHTQPKGAADVMAYFRLLREGLSLWMQGAIQPEGMPSYTAFASGITDVLDELRQHHDGHVLIVSSGGPISIAVGHILGATPEARIALNLQIRNSAVTELRLTHKHHSLVTFNTLPHLDPVDHAEWVTYA